MCGPDQKDKGTPMYRVVPADGAPDYTLSAEFVASLSLDDDEFARMCAWRETLARNLRDAAGCALAWRLHRDFAASWEHGDCDAWCPNLEGVAAPGWGGAA